MTIIYRQCDGATRTKIALEATYKVNFQVGNIMNFLEQVHIVCFGSNNGGLYFKPNKQVVSVKSLDNFNSNKLDDLYGFKEEINIKFDAILAVVEKFPNGIGQ